MILKTIKEKQDFDSEWEQKLGKSVLAFKEKFNYVKGN